jgi:hypothetical protein
MTGLPRLMPRTIEMTSLSGSSGLPIASIRTRDFGGWSGCESGNAISNGKAL